MNRSTAMDVGASRAALGFVLSARFGPSVGLGAAADDGSASRR
jgi:hypothetical protein